MMSKFTKIFLAIVLLFSFGFSLLIAENVYATDAKTNITGRLDNVGKASGYSTSTSGEQGLVTIVGNILKIIFSVLGVVLLGFVLYGGFLWMTSGGNTDGVKKGKQMITNAVIGIVIVVSAYAISSFVMKQLESLNTTSTTGTSTSLPTP
ncbi:MAG TPA: pilin [bacterium]|nr:pilin [bacterium]